MATRKSNKAPSKKAASAKSAAKRATPKKTVERTSTAKSASERTRNSAAQKSKRAPVTKSSDASRRGKTSPTAKRNSGATAPVAKHEPAATATAKGRGQSAGNRERKKPAVRNSELEASGRVDVEIESASDAVRDSALAEPGEEGVAELELTPEDASSEEDRSSDETAGVSEPAFEYEANETGDESLVGITGSSLDSNRVHPTELAADSDGEGEFDEEAPISEPPNSENRLRASEEFSTDGEGSSDEPVMVVAEDILEGESETADTGTLLRSAIEALLFVAEKPVTIKDLAKGLQLDKKRTQELLDELRAEYANRGIRIEEIADGYAFRTHPKIAEYARAFLEQRPVKLSRAQLETLAIVAYRQPITRPEVDDIRGVDCGPVLKGLLERELVRILGKKDEPGRPMLYGTTPAFLDLFGLKSLQELPTLREFAELSEDSRRKYEDTMGEDAPPGLADLGLEPEPNPSDPGAEATDAAELTLDGLLEAAEASELSEPGAELGEALDDEEHHSENPRVTGEDSEEDAESDEDTEDADDADDDDSEEDEDEDADDADEDEDEEDSEQDTEDADDDEDSEDEEDEDEEDSEEDTEDADDDEDSEEDADDDEDSEEDADDEEDSEEDADDEEDSEEDADDDEDSEEDADDDDEEDSEEDVDDDEDSEEDADDDEDQK